MSNPKTTETASDRLVSASVCVVGVLAEALAQHREGAAIVASYTEGRLTLMEYSCSCGWRERSNWADGSTHPAHVASVVAALPNIAIVPLPEPTDTKDYSEGGEGEDYLGWEVQHGPYFISVYDQGEVQVSYNGNVEEPISVDYATDLGTALFAAARGAGGQA